MRNPGNSLFMKNQDFLAIGRREQPVSDLSNWRSPANYSMIVESRQGVRC